MPRFLLFLCSVVLPTLFFARTSPTSFNAERDSVPAENTCEHPATFVKKLGNAQQSELAYSMCLSSDGNVYVAGRQDNDPMIAKITPEGEPIWVRNFPGNPNQRIAFAEIIEDSEGNLVICGTQGDSPGSRRAVVMRYDPVMDNVLWFKQLTVGRPDPSGILEKTPGGNFLLRSNLIQLVDGAMKTRSEIVELDRMTGSVVPTLAVRYLGDGNLRFESMVAYQGSLYAVGSWQVNTLQSMFAKISLANGQPEWVRVTNADTTMSTPNAFSANDIVVDGNQFIITGSGPRNPVDPAAGDYVYLEKRTANGSLQWLKRYDFSMKAEDVVVLPNAYAIFGWMSGNRWGMLKTDQNGNLLEAKILSTASTSPVSIFYNNRQSQLLRTDNQLLMIDNDQSNPSNDILLIKTDFDFNIEDNCALLQSATVTAITLPAKSSSITVSTEQSPAVATDALAAFHANVLEVNKLCPVCLCIGQPDIVLSLQEVNCFPGSAIGTFKLCNIGEDSLSGSVVIGVYDTNPLIYPAHLLQLINTVSISLAPDACLSIVIPRLDSSGLTKLYTLIGSGINMMAQTPVSLDDFPFPNGFTECNYANNLDSFIVLPAPQKPNLGPDRAICQGQTTILNAGSNYSSYHWLNGPNTPSLNVTNTGTYIIEVIDACGRLLRDTVRVTVFPPIFQTRTIQFYAGDTILIDGTAYTQSDTVVQNFTSVVGCDSVLTTFLQLVVTQLAIACRPDLTVTLPANTTTTVVDYTLPTAITNCADPTIEFTLLQGLPVGGLFPEGVTHICYEASNQCGIRDTCCFNITLNFQPCEAQTPAGCVRYELLGIQLDSLGQRQYRVRVVNSCASPLQYAYIQLPTGILAFSPANGATYTAPGGANYLVHNPETSPFYALLYEAVTGGLNNGKNDIFEYTLPEQSAPGSIHVAAKLVDGTYSEAYLNTTNCPEQPYSGTVSTEEGLENGNYGNSELTIRPNPTSGRLFIHLNNWRESQVRVRVMNAQGQLVMEHNYKVDKEEIGLDIDTRLANGLYYLSVESLDGVQVATRFVLAR